MNMKIILLLLSLSFTFSSPPTNCKVCSGHLLLYHELKTEKEKRERIEDFFKYYGTPSEKWAYTFPFEFGLLELIKENGIDYVMEEYNKCKDKKSIRNFCSKLSGFPCKDI